MRRTYLVLVHVQVPDLLELARLGGDAGAAPKGGPGEYRGVAQHGVAAQHVRAVPKPAACSTVATYSASVHDSFRERKRFREKRLFLFVADGLMTRLPPILYAKLY